VFNVLIDLERPIGTYLYGRRMYETMVYWETADIDRGQSPASWEWMGLWRAAEKVVFSTSLNAVSSTRTRIEREFDPEAVRAMKNAAYNRDITIGGPDLAAQALKAGLVDECQLFLTPVIVGGGKSAFRDNVRLPLQLIGERRFGNGVIFLHYRT